MNNLIFIILLVVASTLGCIDGGRKAIPFKEKNEKIDSISKIKTVPQIDTTSLEGKRAYIFQQFMGQESITFDTLLDLNFDQEHDYVIGYYGAAGTGLKNRIQVYLFDKHQKRYVPDEQLSEIINPTFFLKQKKITSFYIGNGSGEGEELEWIDNKWVQTKIFSVQNNDDETKWKIRFPLTGKSKVISMPFQMIPPKNILETEIEH